MEVRREGFVHVAVGVIVGPDGRVLLSRRPDHVHQGGLWEFPGGKVEPGEDVLAALDRELDEELHLRPVERRPLIRIPFRYPDKAVLLDCWLITAFRGEPCGREGQPLRWVEPSCLPTLDFPPANRPIVRAVSLPGVYAISPDETDPGAVLNGLRRALAGGIGLLQLRLPSMPAATRRSLAHAALEETREAGAALLIHRDWELCRDTGADGIHLTSAQLARLERRPLPPPYLVAASCHDPDELERACRLGADFAVLSPVRRTVSHPEAGSLGWDRFRDWIRDVPLPVYALGGMTRDDLQRARDCRAQGVAGIRGFWGNG